MYPKWISASYRMCKARLRRQSHVVQSMLKLEKLAKVNIDAERLDEQLVELGAGNIKTDNLHNIVKLILPYRGNQDSKSKNQCTTSRVVDSYGNPALNARHATLIFGTIKQTNVEWKFHDIRRHD